MEQSAEDYFILSFKYIHAGDNIAALSALDQAIQLDPTNPEYYMQRGSMTREFQENSFGVEDFTKVIEYSKNLNQLKEAYNHRALSHYYLGHIDELLKDLTWLIEHGTQDASTYSWRGHYEYKRKQFEAALRDYEAAYQLSSTEDNLLKRAQVLYQLERYDEALQDLTQIILSKETHPNSLKTIYRWRGSTYYRMGDNLNALADFNEEMRLKGDKPFSNILEYIDKFNYAG